MTAPPLCQGVDPALHCYLDYEQSLFFLIVRRAKRARHANGHVSPLLDARAWSPLNRCEERERLLAECNCYQFVLCTGDYLL